MNFLFSLLGPPLGYIMRGRSPVVQNIGVSIIAFTIIVRIAMFPISVKQQKNTSKSQIFAPRLKEIQTKYRGNNQRMQEEMAKLTKEGYNPVGGCLPMLLTMLILFGVLDVVYKPMTYFERIDRDEITIIKEIAVDVEYSNYLYENAENDDFTEEDAEKFLINLRNPNNRRSSFNSLQGELRAIGVFRNAPDDFFFQMEENEHELKPETLEKLERLRRRIVFMGIDFSETPTPVFDRILLIPILSFLFAAGQTVVMQKIQKKTSPESVQQMGSMKYMFYFMPILSLVIAFQFPAGAGFYWTISSLVGIGQSLIIFKLWPPDKIRAEVMANLEKQGCKSDDVVVVEKYDNKTREMVSTTKKTSEMSSNEQKEYHRKKLEEARKADLKKYGEVGGSQEDSEDEFGD
jgi:YidC/Oxa1 family membrane protein insertase